MSQNWKHDGEASSDSVMTHGLSKILVMFFKPKPAFRRIKKPEQPDGGVDCEPKCFLAGIQQFQLKYVIDKPHGVEKVVEKTFYGKTPSFRNDPKYILSRVFDIASLTVYAIL